MLETTLSLIQDLATGLIHWGVFAFGIISLLLLVILLGMMAFGLTPRTVTLRGCLLLVGLFAFGFAVLARLFR